MKVIGFAGSFYTLWDVKSEKIYISVGASYNKITCTFYQNLSKNLNDAILKAGTENVDETLRGKRRSFEIKTPVTLEPKVMSDAETLFRIIFVNGTAHKAEGVRVQAFERSLELGYLTESEDNEGIYYQWNGELRYDSFWDSDTLNKRFKGII